jgi:CHAT domain-containing protein/tetratricopeptide (TPR) repeat protein
MMSMYVFDNQIVNSSLIVLNSSLPATNMLMFRCISLLVLSTLPALLCAQIVDSFALKKIDSLIQVSRVLTNKKDFDAASSIQSEVETLALACCGPASAAYGSTCFNKGRILHNKRNYSEAEHWYLQAKNIREKALGKTNLDYGMVLYNLGQLYIDMGKYAQAEPFYAELVPLRATALGKNHADYAQAVNQLALVCMETAQYDKAEPLQIEATNVWATLTGRESADYAVSVNNLGLLYLKSGRYSESEKRLTEAMQIREKIVGKEHPDYASSLNNLANLYYNLGYYERAEPLCIAAKDIREKVFGKTHPRYAWSVNNLASLYNAMGQFDKAELLLAEALQIKAQTVGTKHLDYANTLYNQGILYVKMGNIPKALTLLRECQQIRKTELGETHPEYASNLKNLALAYEKNGQYAEAEALLQEALNIGEKALSPDHQENLTTRINLAAVCFGKGDLDRAETLLRPIIEKLTARSDTASEAYILTLVALAKVYQARGQYPTAQAYYEKAQSGLARAQGQQEEYEQALFGRSQVHRAQGDWVAAERCLVEGTTLQQRLLLRASRHLSEVELNLYAAKFAEQSDYVFSFAETRPEAVGHAYNEVLFHKGFLLNVVMQTNRLASTHPEVADVYEGLKGHHRRLAKEYAKAPAAQKDVVLLENEANELEKELSRRVAGMGEALRQVTWPEVQAQLRPGDASVEFVQYRRGAAASVSAKGEDAYAALLLLPGAVQPRFVALCSTTELEKMLALQGRSSVVFIRELYSRASLYRLLWQPLEPFLSSVKTVYFSPAGLLHQLNLEALPTGDDGRILADRYQLIQLSSTRQLALANARPPSQGKEAALFGGIRYDLDSTALAAAQNQSTSSRGTWLEVSDTTYIQTWPSLKWTNVEIKGAAATLTDAGWQAKQYAAYTASESTFKTLGRPNPSPRVVHLATHGFFFSDENKHEENGAEHAVAFKKSRHPMIRSGLILAGANYAWKNGHAPQPDMEDGILTAYEIGQMNFQNTELVVLSACETGLGDIRGNEGVYGLQRAFKIAGAQYLVMSLWQVPDFQAQEFMHHFYTHWLEQHLTVPEAFQKAQKTMRKTHKDPFFWAGFVFMR